jgi:hypothetical protein
MKKDMTTFEMAQAAYENPGKVFASDATFGRLKAQWRDNALVNESGGKIDILPLQRMGYVWEEERTPRKWSGEYESRNGVRKSGQFPHNVVLDDVLTRVKWEAEEVL